MNRFVRMTLLAAAAASLTACSSGPMLGGGKQGAAQALFQASEPASKKGQAAMNRLAAGLTVSESVPCTHGGSATFSLDEDNILADENNVSISFDVEYDACNEDGKNEIDGEMTLGFLLGTDGSTNFEMALSLEGEVEFSGEVDDYIIADITESIDFNGTSAQVTLKLNGTIETRGGAYSFNNETITITDGALPVAADGDDA
jgi:hypothetical protein